MAGKICAARVGTTGIEVPWQALIREEDKLAGPIAEVAQQLADWSAKAGGFG